MGQGAQQLGNTKKPAIQVYFHGFPRASRNLAAELVTFSTSTSSGSNAGDRTYLGQDTDALDFLGICIFYIYIYTYVYVCVYIYIYFYIQPSWSR